MKEIAWHRFRASAAERITGMPGEQQRIKRARGQLSRLDSHRAALSAPMLAEMLFVQSVAPLGIVNHTLTARSVAARWIAFWASTAQGAIHGVRREHQQVWARKLSNIDARTTLLPVFMLIHRDGESFQDVTWTDHVASELESDEEGVTVAINLKRLGFRLAARAEGPLAEVMDVDE